MATGDILSVTIQPNGWTAIVRIEGYGIGGSYDFGLGVDNDPSTAKIDLTVTSPGYDASGNLTTIQRTVYGVPDINVGAVRKVYPNQAQPDETVVGLDVDILVALSDFIYSGDTSITASIGASWYDTNNAVVGLGVTNNSTNTYPKVIGNWAWPGNRLVTGDFPVEFLAFQKFEIASVKFEITDGMTTTTQIVNDLEVSTNADTVPVLAYRDTINTSLFSDGPITVKAKVYPKVGDATTVLDTDDGVNVYPTPLYTNQTYRLDTSGVHGFCVLDPTGGDDGTGEVYDSQVNAEAGNSYQTMGAALTGLQTYHNLNAGHNDAGGGVILLPEGTTTITSTNGGTMTEWVTVKPKTGASKANTLITPGIAGAQFASMVKLEGLTTDTSSNYWRGFDTQQMWFDDIDMKLTGLLVLYQQPSSYVTCSQGVWPNGFAQFGANNSSFNIIRGNNLGGEHNAVGYTVLGNTDVRIQERSAVENPEQNNILYCFNVSGNYAITERLTLANNYNLSGLAAVQNFLVRYGNTGSPLFRISADGSTTTTENILVWHNSMAGARQNLAYNDTPTGGPYLHNNWSVCHNVFDNYNNKDDTFQNNPDATGGWAVGYGVGHRGNHYRSTTADEWLGEFQGLFMKAGSEGVPLEPEYVDDQSASGGDTSGGNYELQESSPALELSKTILLPFDIDGQTRLIGGSSGAYESKIGGVPKFFILLIAGRK